MRAPCGASSAVVFPPRDNPRLLGESFWLGLEFFPEGDTFIAAVATVLIAVEVLRGRKPADQDR